MSIYRQLTTGGRDGVLAESELADRYAHPDPGDRAWVRTNFVSTLDGAVQGRDGRSATINTASDRAVFAQLRTHADVVLVGAGTARAEQYRAVDLQDAQREQRARLGLSPYPTLAIVSASGNLPARLVPDEECGPVLVLTSRRSRAGRPDFCEGVEVVEFDDPDQVPVELVIAELARRGLRRVLCEGGPHLNAQLHQAGLVDDLCLTLSPLVIAGAAHRTTVGPRIDEDRFRLEHAILADDNALLLRYLRT
ncbi:hypothetical protein GCM10011575_07640 [Microlunatus endophyticus]|uniref:Bacterial bifunctional deaminase-reductase C-terminal domain-containing protein n=1 Tax=Microlunatus endophyticus TaxID=1716077 RepID=A0A917W1M4_9ACTN|nr:pyrimidine reductase family protein [Microlunatus endophyticus]GGL51847.1 hypothetical protein GCM10011575_07640 [Microlunatus endophyticus]